MTQFLLQLYPKNGVLMIIVFLISSKLWYSHLITLVLLFLTPLLHFREYNLQTVQSLNFQAFHKNELKIQIE